MRIERTKVKVWNKITEQSPFAKGVTKFLSDSAILKKINKTGIRKALNMAKIISVQRKHEDLEFLISCWSIESHTFIVAWGEFGPTLEDIAALTYLPIFGNSNAISITHNEIDKKKF